MSDIVIRVENLAKRYRISQQESYQTLRDVLTNAFRAPFHRLSSRVRPASMNGNGQRLTNDEWMWALQDVAFDVKRGEIVGIIGRNGAGKSTILKILSRITKPTEGSVDLHGRVGSLLEVGTGFHPELTGRENVYLNGAILGMKKVEIERKFDDIVAFAEIEKFMDMPVKRYSSGMYMRLAFAVAAHLEPEILLVDEVLAVGDAAFQKKCLGKMGDVTKEGRTVIFVSHNMAAVQSLCDRVVWLHEGRVIEAGHPGQIVSRYLQTSFSALTEQVWPDMITAPGNDKVRLHRASVRPVDGIPSEPITVRTPLVMEFEYWNLQPGTYVYPSLYLYNEQGIVVFNVGPVAESVWQRHPFPAGLFRDVCRVPGDLLNDGLYQVELLILHGHQIIHRQTDILIFNVHDTVELRDGWYGKWDGTVRPLLDWNTALLQAADKAFVAPDNSCEETQD